MNPKEKRKTAGETAAATIARKGLDSERESREELERRYLVVSE